MDALIVGTGPTVLEDLKLFKSEFSKYKIFAVNWAGNKYTEMSTDFIVSLHPQDLKEMASFSPFAYTISYQDADINILVDKPWDELTSGMYAICVAKMLGYSKIYVAGLSLDDPTYDRKVLQSSLDELKDALYNVVVPDGYWWKKFTGVEDGETQFLSYQET